MKLLSVVGILFLVALATAVPNTGVAVDVNSNGFNTTITGVSGTDCWISWGDYSGAENWVSPNATATAGSATIQVIGAPIFGGEHIVYQGCDPTGCGSEQTVTISDITPMPTTTFGVLIKNITNSRFDPTKISQGIQSTYTQVAPFAVVIGVALLFFMIGIWTRTKSVRLIAILGVLIAPFVMLNNQGLYLGIPSSGMLLAKGLLAAAIAGILVMFMRR